MFDPSFDDGFWHPVESHTNGSSRSAKANYYFDDSYPFSALSDDPEYVREMEEKRALARRLVVAARSGSQASM